MKSLYKIKLKDYQTHYVVAESPDVAIETLYKNLTNWKYRTVSYVTIELLSEESRYPSCGVALHIQN